MDTSAFAATLDGIFAGSPADGVHADPRFTAITAELAAAGTRTRSRTRTASRPRASTTAAGTSGMP